MLPKKRKKLKLDSIKTIEASESLIKPSARKLQRVNSAQHTNRTANKIKEEMFVGRASDKKVSRAESAINSEQSRINVFSKSM